jgi:HK97 family phage prohead protease
MEKRNYDLSGLEVRAASDDGTGKAGGYAAVFNSDSHDLGGFIEVIEPGAFKRSLAQAQAGTLNIFALWAHSDAQPLGSTGSGKLSLSEDERGLAFELDTKRFTPAQLDSLADGELRMSFGFMVREQEWKELEDGSILRTLKEVDLSEVSFVINPAYPDTSAAKRSLDKWQEGRVTPATVAEEIAEAFEDHKAFDKELTDCRKRAVDAIIRSRGKL